MDVLHVADCTLHKLFQCPNLVFLLSWLIRYIARLLISNADHIASQKGDVGTIEIGHVKMTWPW